jgi:RecJ-like exonuclease
MMKKKISILTLTFLFLVSTTGLPIYSHYCEMMGKRSSSECEMCKAEIEKVESSCCSENTSDNNLKLTNEKSTCCVQEFDFKKINDDYSQSFNSNFKIASVAFVSLNSSTLSSDKTETHSQQVNCNLPPPKFGIQLLHTIHQLKINLPFC